MKAITKTIMIKKLLSLDWSELLFPVYNDIKNINEEASTTVIANNNWDLMNEESKSEYNAIITKIKENREDEKLSHDVIVM
jgi:hypothetical protein